jgi:hypothetical protein
VNINDIGKYIKPMLLTISDLVVDRFLDSLAVWGLEKVAFFHETPFQSRFKYNPLFFL